MPEPAPLLVALFRGVNVGGKNVLPMKRLVEFFERAGAVDVASYIQSGNVVFRATREEAPKLVADVGTQIGKSFGFSPPIVVRSGTELRKIVAKNPFRIDGADESRLHVGFLDRAPSAAAVRALDPQKSPPDRFAVIGSELFLELPNGVGKTKLTTAYLDRTLSAVCTIRNFRTVQALAKLAT